MLSKCKCLPTQAKYWLTEAVHQLKLKKERDLKENPKRRILKLDIEALEQVQKDLEKIPHCEIPRKF